jgi:hypothetical protein
MNRELVIASYGDDLAWTANFFVLSLKIYEKGEHYGISKLPNVGHEAHTYLHHIVSNYSYLAAITIFTQGHPYKHCNAEDIALWPLITDTAYYSYSNNYDTGERFFYCDLNGEPQHPGLPIERVWRELFTDPPPQMIKFCPGGIFSVGRDLILAHPREFYEKALEMVSHDVDPIEGYVFERLWRTIFDGKTT